MASPSPVRVVSRRTVKPPPRPRERIPLTSWDPSMLDGDYIQKGLLFAPPPFPTARLVDHLHASLADALAAYYPVAGRFSTDHHRDGEGGVVVGCSVSIDCAGQGAEILHAVADGVAVADIVAPPDADVPRVVLSFFPLDGAANYDGHELPLLAVQVTELVDGVFVGFAYNHALSDGTSCWSFLNAWAEIARVRLAPPGAPRALKPPLLERWSPDGGAAAPIVLPYADLAALVRRQPAPELRERMLYFSPESLVALKERARRDLLEAGDTTGAAAVTRFQALSSLLWRLPDQQPPPPPAAAAGGVLRQLRLRAVDGGGGRGGAAGARRPRVGGGRGGARRGRAHGRVHPAVSLLRPAPETDGVVMASSPRFDVYGCDFGWGKPLAVRSGKANKFDGNVWLYPGREGGGGIEVEVALAPEHMAALEKDDELWAAVSPGKGIVINSWN